MLDKSKIYTGFTKPYRGRNQSPSKRFKRVRILFEDDISYYVESLTTKDAKGHGIRYSVKKHCFTLFVVDGRPHEHQCKGCPLYMAHLKMKDA